METKSSLINTIYVGVLTLLLLPFAFYAAERGFLVANPMEQSTSRFFDGDNITASYALYLHMVTGACISVLALFQLLKIVRAKTPRAHRFVGRLTATLAIMTAFAGTYYIVAVGTIGGWWMDLGFGIYGALLFVAALKTWQLARNRDPRHPVWAVRLILLALASWFYRVHYGVWELTTGGLGTSPDFTGMFDRVQVFAFYLPYLAFYEVWRRRAKQ